MVFCSQSAVLNLDFKNLQSKRTLMESTGNQSARIPCSPGPECAPVMEKRIVCQYRALIYMSRKRMGLIIPGHSLIRILFMCYQSTCLVLNQNKSSEEKARRCF